MEQNEDGENQSDEYEGNDDECPQVILSTN